MLRETREVLPPSFQQFRKAQAPPAPQSSKMFTTPSPYPGIKGDLPLGPGQAIKMTPLEERSLAQLGIKPGDAVPANLAEAIARAREEARNVEGLLPVDPDTPPLEVDEQELSSLSLAKQQELIKAIQEMQASAAQFRDVAPIVGPQGPNASLNEALRVAAAASPPFVDKRPPVVASPIDAFRAPRAPVAATALPAAPQDSELAAAKAKIAELEQALETALTRLPGKGLADASGAAELGNCQHCGWDLNRPDELPLDSTDKYAYLAAILGGPNTRYRKEIDLFGGTVRCTLRWLTSEESDMVSRQITADDQAGQLRSANEVMARIVDYRTALTLERISCDGSPPVVHVMPEAASVPVDKGDETPLPLMLRYLRSQMLPTETLRRAVGYEYHRFHKLVEKLEANASNPDFWKGIASLA